MHLPDELLKQIGELLKVVIPLIASYTAYNRAGRALKKARAVEEACTYPACGHVCKHANAD